jgi:hypothetical protein
MNTFSISGGVNVKQSDFLSCFIDVKVYKRKIIIGCWPAVLVRSITKSSHVQELRLDTQVLKDMKLLCRRKKIKAM